MRQNVCSDHDPFQILLRIMAMAYENMYISLSCFIHEVEHGTEGISPLRTDSLPLVSKIYWRQSADDAMMYGP